MISHGPLKAAGIDYLDNLVKLVKCENKKDIALLSLNIVKTMGPIGLIAGTLGEYLLTMNDEKKKSDVQIIQDGLSTLQDRLLEEFSSTRKEIASIDCKGRLSEHKNVIHTAFI